MTNSHEATYTTFQGHRRIASGPLQRNALAAKHAIGAASSDAVLIFDDATGRTIDVDVRGSDADVVARHAPLAVADNPSTIPDEAAVDAVAARGRGRPRLGVVPREVTLLPRHWEWLATQPGGASVMLRKLVDDARRAKAETDRRRMAQERAYHFMQAIGGDFPGFEEATRALFADDATRLTAQLATWPDDVRDHAMRLAFGDAALDEAGAR